MSYSRKLRRLFYTSTYSYALHNTFSNATSVGVARMRPSASVVPERGLRMMPVLRIFP